MTTKIADISSFTAEERLRLYTVEEVIAMKLLPYTLRTLRIACHQRRVPHTTSNRKIRFRIDHILAIQQAGDVNPATRGRRAA